MRQWLVSHHISPETVERDRRRREALARQGFADSLRRFPTNPDTQKCNWAEVLLAECIRAACNAQIPIYRLRHNPNVEQSMKGDDVLAFDLGAQPVRVIVGEAKFRATPSKQVVEEIVQVLTRSSRAGIPVSLQFVADQLFTEGREDLGEKVDGCNVLFAQGALRLDYVGFLVSDEDAHTHVHRNAKPDLQRLAIMSLELNDPNGTVAACYLGLEDKS
jgi:hypothetical protein